MIIEVPNLNDIYLVDDDEDYHFLLRRYFEKKRTVENKLVSFSSGEDCLLKTQEIADTQGTRPSIILMDYNMTGMNGVECIKRIRAIDVFSTLPTIIMLSSSNYQKDIDDAIEAGANYYCEKPFNLNDFVFKKIETISLKCNSFS